MSYEEIGEIVGIEYEECLRKTIQNQRETEENK